MTSSQRIVLVLLLVSILTGVITGSVFYYRLGYVWIFVLVGSWFMSWQALRGISIKRMIRTHRSQVGQIFEERFIITNRGKLPKIWIEVRDKSNLPGANGSHVLSLLKGKEVRTYLSRTRLIERGIFPLGPTELVSGDLFGLFPIEKTSPIENSLLVYPMMVEINTFPSPAGWLPGGEALRRRTHQITPNASGVREYAPGDPINRIHWLSTARRNRFIVKEFELDPQAEVWIFLDAYKYAHESLPYDLPQFDARDRWRPIIQIPLKPSTIEYGVTIAASLSRYYLQHNRAIGFVSVSRSIKMLPSDRGPRQLGKILEALAIIKCDGNLPIEGIVEAQSRNIPRGSTVVIISSAPGKGIILAVEDLILRGFKPIVVYIDGRSFGGSGSSEDAITIIPNLKIPYCIISNEDDLSSILSNSFPTPFFSGKL
jgi:uncharacterized protein (DUF58 family)